jgi:hypothetical protein
LYSIQGRRISRTAAEAAATLQQPGVHGFLFDRMVKDTQTTLP